MKKNIYTMIAAIAINNIGDVIFDLFIVWNLSSATGNLMNAVYVIGTSVAFRAILAFVIGSYMDKHKKKETMIYAHIASMVVILCFGVVWETAKKFVVLSLIFVLINDINNELFRRSYILLTSDMFDKNLYIKFQSYSNVVIRIVSIGGAAVAGILIDHMSSYAIFFIDIITYLISMLLILSVKYDECLSHNKISHGIFNGLFDDLKYTLKAIYKSSYLRAFTMLMFILNLGYGYIPQILPLQKASISESAFLLGSLKSAITIGEIAGLFVAGKMSRYVSATFKTSMILNILIIMVIACTNNTVILLAFFFMYGFSDSLTQPLFGYTVSSLDTVNRGKLLGGIDTIIMFSPSIGIYTISAISNYSSLLGGIVVCTLFISGFFIVVIHNNMRHIVLSDKL